MLIAFPLQQWLYERSSRLRYTSARLQLLLRLKTSFPVLTLAFPPGVFYFPQEQKWITLSTNKFTAASPGLCRHQLCSIVLPCWTALPLPGAPCRSPTYRKKYDSAGNSTWKRPIVTGLFSQHFSFLCYRQGCIVTSSFLPMLLILHHIDRSVRSAPHLVFVRSTTGERIGS